MSVIGPALFCVFSLPLLAFCIALAGAARRGTLPPDVRRQGWIVLGLYLVVFAAFYISAWTIVVPGLDWVAEGLLIVTGVLVGLFLRRSLTRPIRIISWLLMAGTLLQVLFLPFDFWIAAQAKRVLAYNNTNESAVRAALVRNPDDAAAHSSLAHIDQERGDRVGAVKEWGQVLRVEPDNLDALLLLSGGLTREGKIDEARPLFQRLATRNDDFSVNARKWLVRHGGR